MMKETDIAKLVIEWLESQHWDVYQEVKFRSSNSISDIAAVQAGRLWIIECKTSLTWTVLEQASYWRAHFRSIAIPAPSTGRGRGTAYNIAHNYLKLGVLDVGHYVNVSRSAPLMREYHKHAKKMIAQLCEEHKRHAPAGSRNGGYYTPYRDTMNRVERYIYTHPGCTLKEIMDSLDHHHYSTDKTAKNSIRIALSTWEHSWCDVQLIDHQLRYFHKGLRQGDNT